jgi:hypothetical protein
MARRSPPYLDCVGGGTASSVEEVYVVVVIVLVIVVLLVQPLGRLRLRIRGSMVRFDGVKVGRADAGEVGKGRRRLKHGCLASCLN